MTEISRRASHALYESPFLIGAVVVVLCFGQAGGQTPQRTAATYDDWTVSCVTGQGGSKKSCAIMQSQTAQGQASPVSQVTISGATKDSPAKLFIQVPGDVWIPGGVTFLTDGAEPRLAATFILCASARCIAAAQLADASVTSLRAQKTPGRFVYKTASQTDVSIPVSFKGFNEALDALQKE